NGLMGGIEEGQKAFAWIKRFARETPYQVEQVMESFARLKAFGLDPMDGTLRKIADATARVGGSQETLLGITNALGQMWGKQKISAEEMLQLTERGIPAWSRLSEAMGLSVAELRKMS